MSSCKHDDNNTNVVSSLHYSGNDYYVNRKITGYKFFNGTTTNTNVVKFDCQNNQWAEFTSILMISNNNAGSGVFIIDGNVHAVLTGGTPTITVLRDAGISNDISISAYADGAFYLRFSHPSTSNGFLTWTWDVQFAKRAGTGSFDVYLQIKNELVSAEC